MVIERRPALLVPDRRVWALAGYDPAAAATRAVDCASEAEVLVAPATLPESIGDGVRAAWTSIGPPRRLAVVNGPPIGSADVQAFVGEADHASGHEVPGAPAVHSEAREHGMSHGDHGGMSHHDMMEIRGNPSADGLVMEELEIELGPISPSLPTGLVAKVTLDGEVACVIRLRRAPIRGPDPSAPIASRVARSAYAGPPAEGWRAVGAIEVERALSHLHWLRSLASLLGWSALAGHAASAAKPLIGLPAALLDESRSADSAVDVVGIASGRVDTLLALAQGSRTLHARLRARGVIGAADIARLGLAGVSARASGAAVDGRDNPWYAALGFAVRTRREGDALARTELRVHEAVEALRLAGAALAADRDRVATPDAVLSVEGPRGPVGANGWHHGDNALTEAVAGAAAHQEWSSVLATLLSFDPPAWTAAR